MSRELADDVLAAAEANDAGRLQALLAQGASPNAVWESREVPESRRANEEIDAPRWEALAMPGAPQAPPARKIPLHVAVGRGSIECVTVLLAHKNLLVDAKDECGGDALNELFEGAGADAASLDDDEIAIGHALIQAGLPLVQRSRGNSRLWTAAFAESLGGVEFLLDAGHPVDTDTETSPLHAICWHWDYQDEERNAVTRGIVRALLAAGVSPSVRDSQGGTPLHETMRGDGTNLVAAAELLAAGANVNAQDHDLQTPLHVLYENLFDYAQAVPFMLGHGANPRVKDKWGRTVIDVARSMIGGGEPQWRTDEFKGAGGPPCGWKHPAEQGDIEYRILKLLEEA